MNHIGLSGRYVQLLAQAAGVTPSEYVGGLFGFGPPPARKRPVGFFFRVVKRPASAAKAVSAPAAAKPSSNPAIERMRADLQMVDLDGRVAALLRRLPK